MGLTRVATLKSEKSDDALIMAMDGKTIELSQAVIADKTEKQIETLLASAASLSAVQLPDIFVHINDDGSLAIATGAAPDVWPEDEGGDLEAIRG